MSDNVEIFFYYGKSDYKFFFAFISLITRINNETTS